MIRLSMAQLEMAVALAREAHSSAALKDGLPAGEFIEATTGPTRSNPIAARVTVEVPRASVVARLNERHDAALADLRAMGIELDPA